MYYYILGCGIACLVLFGINSMDTVCVKPAEILGKVILWPLALMEAVVRYSSTHHNIKTALYNISFQTNEEQSGGCAFKKEGAAAFLFCTLRRGMVQ